MTAAVSRPRNAWLSALPGAVPMASRPIRRIECVDVSHTGGTSTRVGMVVVVSPETAEAALGALKAEGIDAYVCGEIVTGEEKICLC